MNILGTTKRLARFLGEVRKAPYPRLAYISGWLGNGNLGDEILPQAMAELFRPFSMIHFAGERSVGYINKLSHSVDGGLLAGGTLINSAEKYLADMETGARFLPKVFVFGCGVRDPSFWQHYEDFQDNRLRWRDVLKRCEFVGVRGPISAGLLADIGVSAEIVGDPALAFFDESREVLPEDSEVRLGLNIGQDSGRIWGSEERLIQQYIILARKARRMGWRVTWFVVWPEDLEVTQRVAEESGTSEDIFLEYDSADRYLERAREMTFFTGMKLHAVILAICAGLPSLMVEYRPKCRDFMQSINQEDATIRSDAFQGAEAFEMLQDWLGEMASRRATLRKEVGSLATLQRQAAREIVCRILESE